MTKPDNLKDLIRHSRELAFPGQTLCLIEFDNGKDTNDFIPNEILSDDDISTAQWWNEENKEDYLPLARGECKAIRITPIQEH